MKNKLRLITMTALMAITFGGCSSEAPRELEADTLENDGTLESSETLKEMETAQVQTQAEEAITAETEAEPQDLVESSEFTFTDLSTKQFSFTRGAGGWSEEFTIEKDGYFTGLFHDSDMGDIGEGYEDGTRYSSSYSGHFTDLTKINDYTYQMKLADISYKEAADTVKISDNVRYIYTESSCLGGTDTFTIYLPGTPLSEISEEIYIWISAMNQSETELTMIAIVDETNGYGMYSYDRLAPLEDALGAYRTCKESCDYYGDKLSEAYTTLEMVAYSGMIYNISDDCLNYIWNLIRYNVDEDKYQEILAEQREWIAEKEAAAKEASAEYEGGSFSTVAYNDVLGQKTLERCEELIEYLK